MNSPRKMKTCTTCKIYKNVNEFHKSNKNQDGYQYSCKKCKKLYNQVNQQDYRNENKEHIALYMKDYQCKHKELLSERGKLYRKENKEGIASYMKEYQKKKYKSDIKYKTIITTGKYITLVVKPAVFKRDHYMCQTCHCKNDLIIHHIIPVSKDILKIKEIDNLITLCKKCHFYIAHLGAWTTLNEEAIPRFQSIIQVNMLLQLEV